ncbi:uncharacterized protein [Clytia hemisphaerica]|uniref:PA14 domain-containing protein n=1 Tax=Clytia hemisphaerica TaxID=252671 RepID=A0A7M5V9M9_9CNID
MSCSKTVFVFYLLITASTASNILRLPKYNKAKFILKHNNKAHATSPYKTEPVRNLYKCLDKCTYDTQCKSVNFDERNPNSTQCQYVAQDRNDLDSYVDAPGIRHYDTGRTTLTKWVMTSYTSFCVVPETYSCDVTSANQKLMITSSTTHCEAEYAYFDYDIEYGILYHHCSGREIGYTGDYITFVPQSKANKLTNFYWAWVRDWKSFLTKSTHCIRVDSISNGFHLMKKDNEECETTSAYFKFTFPSLPAPSKVWTTVFESTSTSADFWSITSASSYPNSYTHSGYMDDFTIIASYKDYAAIRMQTYFVAPKTGYYTFNVACNEQCILYHGETESTKQLIVQQTTYGHWVNYAEWLKYPAEQQSAGIYMEEGRDYYMEGLYRETGGKSLMNVAFRAPGFDVFRIVSYRYLKKY